MSRAARATFAAARVLRAVADAVEAAGEAWAESCRPLDYETADALTDDWAEALNEVEEHVEVLEPARCGLLCPIGPTAECRLDCATVRRTYFQSSGAESPTAAPERGSASSHSGGSGAHEADPHPDPRGDNANAWKRKTRRAASRRADQRN